MNLGIAVPALALLAGFLGILIWHVPRADLAVVVAITLLLVVVDLVTGRPGKG
jgi:hypothetical protein